MRHRKKFNHLGRKSAHRKAMLSNMASSLILHKRIKTTVAKAKALRMYVEPLITKSKEDSTHSRRVVFSYLKDKIAVSELFREISAKVASRPGGYTRILKTGNRLGDNADMCIIELVDYNENMLTAKEEAKAKTTRRSRRGKKKADTTVTAETKEQVEDLIETVEETEEKVEEKIEEKSEDIVDEVKAVIEEVPETEEKVEEKTGEKSKDIVEEVKDEIKEVPEKEKKAKEKSDSEEKEEK